ncbi:MAG: ABC transporter permease subunit [Rhodospirillum sp.]|nr:ABC transporter permease subunit [Rhodospirillum sp.]MCF8489572.1 ABC transporter permease subunit [Rhodospirillum sp.]MCF8501604.1 ABC transporter permease subunit [Rhodospirillum sp.]
MTPSSLFLRITAWLGFLFLYAPIASLVIFSFNESKLVTVWGGFSTKWYGALFRDPQILAAGWISLKIGFFSATIAVVIGTLAAYVLSRFSRFRGRTWLSGAIAAPLVMPDVIIGLSLLLLFVAMEHLFGWPQGRGILTIVIAHATFGAAYVAVVAQSRLVGMDLSLEEAAEDLGAHPVRVFFDITLPVIAPALVSGWLLAFTLSLDDLVIASFVTGPGASTLPMVIFSKVRLGVSPDVNALATLVIGIVSIGILVAASNLHRAARDKEDAAPSHRTNEDMS